jgi:hypothetical protein
LDSPKAIMTIGVASDGRGSRFGAQPGLWSELPLRVLADLDQQPRFRVLRPSTRPVVRASSSGAAEASGASRLTPIGEGARLIHHGRNTLLLLRRLVKLEENSAAVPALTSRRPRVATLSFRLTSVLSFQLNDRRCLRLLEEADADELYAVVGANRGYLAEWMPWAAGQTLADTLEFIRNR